MNTKFAINIGRQLGSGGRLVGVELAKLMNVSFYDKELITLSSKASGISKKIIEGADEKATFSLSKVKLALTSSPFIGDGFVDNYLCNDSMFKIQSDVIKQLASEQSCIFVGRCADYILRDYPNVVNIFVSADLPERIKRVADHHNLTEKKALELIEKTDKKRAAYYNYYSNKQWGAAVSYHLCINSSIGIEKTVDFIRRYVQIKLGVKV